MSKNSLSEIPNEIIVKIFQSMARFATATALSRTSRGLLLVWEANTTVICSAILTRIVPCHDQACEYVRARPPDATSSEWTEDPSPPAIKVTKRISHNAAVACRALRLDETRAIQCGCGEAFGRSGLSGAQRTGFLQAWYRIHTLASLPPEYHNYDTLDPLDHVGWWQMLGVVYWLRYWCPQRQTSLLSISIPHGCMKGRYRGYPKSSISVGSWRNLMVHLRRLHQDMHRSPFSNGCLEQKENWSRRSKFDLLNMKESGEPLDYLPN